MPSRASRLRKFVRKKTANQRYTAIVRSLLPTPEAASPSAVSNAATPVPEAAKPSSSTVARAPSPSVVYNGATLIPEAATLLYSTVAGAPSSEAISDAATAAVAAPPSDALSDAAEFRRRQAWRTRVLALRVFIDSYNLAVIGRNVPSVPQLAHGPGRTRRSFMRQSSYRLDMPAINSSAHEMDVFSAAYALGLVCEELTARGHGEISDILRRNWTAMRGRTMQQDVSSRTTETLINRGTGLRPAMPEAEGRELLLRCFRPRTGNHRSRW